MYTLYYKFTLTIQCFSHGGQNSVKAHSYTSYIKNNCYLVRKNKVNYYFCLFFVLQSYCVLNLGFLAYTNHEKIIVTRTLFLGNQGLRKKKGNQCRISSSWAFAFLQCLWLRSRLATWIGFIIVVDCTIWNCGKSDVKRSKPNLYLVLLKVWNLTILTCWLMY